MGAAPRFPLQTLFHTSELAYSVNSGIHSVKVLASIVVTLRIVYYGRERRGVCASADSEVLVCLCLRFTYLYSPSLFRLVNSSSTYHRALPVRAGKNNSHNQAASEMCCHFADWSLLVALQATAGPRVLNLIYSNNQFDNSRLWN